MGETPSDPASSSRLERLLPLLVHLQTHWFEALPVSELARRAGWSPAQFHRQFRLLTGETPIRYCRRLRLERAAFRLLIERTRVVDIAGDCGFRSHETFTRAFRRQFGVTPRIYRARQPRPSTASPEISRPRLETALPFQVSATHVRELADLPLAFIRHVGPYEDVDPTSWDRLMTWADQNHQARPRVLAGVAHDAPGITPDHQLRFDAGLRVSAPQTFDGEFGFQVLPRGPYAVTTHVGPYDTLVHAYRQSFEHMATSRRYNVLGLPAIEIYHATRINPELALNHTDVCIPLAIGSRATSPMAGPRTPP